MLISSRIKTSVWFPAALIAASVIVPAVAQARPTYGPVAGGTIADATLNTTTFTATPGVTVRDITVADTYTIQSLNSVTLTGLTHSFVGDLQIQFQHVNTGTTVDLVYRLGQLSATDEFDPGLDSNFNGTYTFALAGSSLLTQAQQGNTTYNIPSGTYAASTSLDAAAANPNTLSSFNGQNIGGTWRLSITDYAVSGTGSFTSWQFNATAATVTVPEAGTLALFAPALGAIGVFFARRRRIAG